MSLLVRSSATQTTPLSSRRTSSPVGAGGDARPPRGVVNGAWNATLFLFMLASIARHAAPAALSPRPPPLTRCRRTLPSARRRAAIAGLDRLGYDTTQPRRAGRRDLAPGERRPRSPQAHPRQLLVARVASSSSTPSRASRRGRSASLCSRTLQEDLHRYVHEPKNYRSQCWKCLRVPGVVDNANRTRPAAPPWSTCATPSSNAWLR